MSLTKLQKVQPEALTAYRIEQIVALAGDGRLKDQSSCAAELREYLRTQSISSLRRYIKEILAQSFTESGFVLQDLVNEVGRRLGFLVENGRYRGVSNRSGQDGLWQTSTMSLVVEVKTTDAYRINLTTVAAYAQALRPTLKNSESPIGLLYVVGRQDTGDLEAQIRGSRYAWDARVISAEALLDLAELLEVAVDDETEKTLRSALLPVEYTRIDSLVQMLTKLAFDVERSVQVEQLEAEKPSNSDVETDSKAHQLQKAVSQDEVRATVLSTLQRKLGSPLSQLTKSVYETSHEVVYIVSVSKRYERTDQNYWFALQAKWIDKLKKQGSHICLAMLDKDYYLQIPGARAIEFTTHLNKTTKTASAYWHVGLTEQSGRLSLNLSKVAKIIDLSEFKVAL